MMVPLKTLRHGRVCAIAEAPDTLLVEATSAYIPIGEFKILFDSIGELVKERKTTCLIFDKRKLSIFHQPSMEWYFVEWKEEMYSHGLIRHRKILPDDRIFRESVKIGREKIYNKYPQGKFHLLDIQYAESIEEALQK